MSMDYSTEKIIERTRERRQKLDEELSRSSSKSPSSKGQKIKKRKSSDRHNNNVDSTEFPKNKENEENPPKKPSFDENDKAKPLRRSLYPNDELDEIKKRNEEVSHESKVSDDNFGGGQPSTPTTSSRKARLAALGIVHKLRDTFNQTESIKFYIDATSLSVVGLFATFSQSTKLTKAFTRFVIQTQELPGFWIRKSVFDKPTAKPVLPSPVPAGGVWKPSAQPDKSQPAVRVDKRVSPEKEAGERKTTVSQLKARWEISSATGTPLHPTDDLGQAAVKLACTMLKSKSQLQRCHAVAENGSKPSELQTSDQLVEEKQAELGEQLMNAETVSCDESSEEGTEDTDASRERSTKSATAASADDSQSQEGSIFDSELDAGLDDAFVLASSVDTCTDDQRYSVENEKKPAESFQAILDCPPRAEAQHQLVHSVSFYRNQQRQSRLESAEGVTPILVKPVPISPAGKHPPEDKSAMRKAERQAYDNKVEMLNTAVSVQQEQIAQASRALNFCRNTQEFRGSREEVDAQRALLLATERRRCLIEELDRVYACRKEHKPIECQGPRGTLTISHISIPLKREFVNDNINMTSGLSSPGGPMAVLDPSFQRLGHMQLSLHAVNRGKFRLDGVQFSCPIEGALLMKLRCFAESAGEVEDQGFLSAYEEISGLGSWTRMWCVLKKGAMKFWRYPDDQNTKDALNLVDLGRCITEKVRIVNREMCSRSNTFYVDIVTEIDKRSETFRIMLSADTKEECIRWCESINETLINMRMWNPESRRLDALS